MKRVVVTGLGAVTPLGNTVAEYWGNLLAGKSGVAPITHFDASNFEVKIAGEVKNFEPGEVIDRKEARRMDFFVQYSMVAAHEALRNSGLNLDQEDRTRIGVIIGCGIGGIGVLEVQQTILLQKGADRVSPFLVPMMIPDMAAGHVAIRHGLQGPNASVVTACASGTNALVDASRIIRCGEADVMIAGGSESAITPLGVSGFISAKALSQRNAEPTRASRPFDRDRDGFVMAEGAGIAILESLDHAVARGARILAEVIGYGQSDDAYHITSPLPDGGGGALAMERAIRDAGISPGDVNYINAHGTSTMQGDVAETLAIKKVFGDSAKKLAVSSTKSMTGHALGAAGGIEFVAVIKSLEEQILHPTINLENPDPQCDLDYIREGARRAKVEYALSNSFGFGGHNVSILAKRFQG